ncbi:MFS transporter [Pontibacillus halophilus JSM 076056 = DSM 19796]|uniref:MFS transporter n=1 Tax=Pontibacillus halophilus JSM 076056 = DSM 19796 TaxID=1385510 RepID=A0A0A5GC29_9BACI|nr:MFS transporter [Pontibacillus halophilus]KGX88758.1 MFS transporter [Pontibacillus halophilus JSM 076056 = DSM 19796]
MKFREFHRNIKIRIVETFVSRFIGSMIFPFMSIYLAVHFGATVAGLLLLINVGIGIGINFLGGYFADQFGRKKVMLWAELLRFLAFMTMALCNSPWYQSPSITFAMMTVNSICWGLAGPANHAMLIDVSLPSQRKVIYSITYWVNNLSIAVGGIIGAFLFKDYLFELFIALSFSALFVVVIVMFFIIESHFPERTKMQPVQHVKKLLSSYKSVLNDRLFVLFTVAGVLTLSMEFQLTNYIGIRLSEEMPTQTFLFWEVDGVKTMGFLRSENTILVAILMLFAARLSKSFQDRPLLVGCSFLFTIGYGALAYSNNLWVLVIMMAILTVGEVLKVPVEQSYMASIPPEHARSTYMAFNGLKFNLSMLIASLTVAVSSILPTTVMAILILLIGLTGTWIYHLITPQLDVRKRLEMEMEEVSGTLES